MLWSLLFILLIGQRSDSRGSQCGTNRGSNCKCEESSESHDECLEDLRNLQKSTLNGTTSQSSNHVDRTGTFSSDRALDGNERTCARTNKTNNSWWTIDLHDVYDICSITICNTDAHHDDMSGARILIGNSRENNGTKNSIVATIKDFEKEKCNVYKCEKKASGRYITVHQPKEEPVVLCEVRIIGTKQGQGCSSECQEVMNSCEKCVKGPGSVSECKQVISECDECLKSHWSDYPYTDSTQLCKKCMKGLWPACIVFIESCEKCVKDLLNSLTLNGTTSQSSVYVGDKYNHSSDRALDGKAGLCAHTNKEENSWWTIDLQGVYDISSITIFNTYSDITDLSGARILIGNSRENNGTTNSICTNITDFKRLECNVYKCNKTTSGRYITVYQPEKKFVILCEVRINGTRKESRFELIKEEKTWEEALNYCRNHHENLASILNEEDQAWAELEAKKADTTFVWLGLRYSCVLDFWFWVADHRLEFSRWAPEKKTGECDMSVAMDKTEDYQWFSKPDNEKFNFICEK